MEIFQEEKVMQIETNNLVKVSQCNVNARVSVTINTAQKMKFSIKDFFSI